MMKLHVLFLAVSILLSCKLSAAKRNIVLFVTDDESPTLGCYGDPVAKTPHLDALAADGTRFTHAFATTASCSASRSVILSGLHNHANGQYGHQHHYHKFSSYRNVRSLPRLLAEQGYRTIQIGKYHVAPEDVYHFETYIRGPGRNAVQMANNLREVIAANTDKPFFIYFATSDPHRGGGVDKRSPHQPDLFGNRPDGGSHNGVEEVFYRPEDVPVPHFLPDSLTTRAELAHYYQSVSRIDTGLGTLVHLLKEAGVYEDTLIAFTSDHGMAFAGGKTTTYDPGLRVPFVVRNPYEKNRGVVCDAMISHVDITPSLLDFAGGYDAEKRGPKTRAEKRKGEPQENTGPVYQRFHGRSWLPVLGQENTEGWDQIGASHTFHEIQMYYPMRVVQDRDFKLIWNIAWQLPYPFASDLWASPTWQHAWQQGPDTLYGKHTVQEYVQRKEFEFFAIGKDPTESTNLAEDPEYATRLEQYKQKLKTFQKETNDPWIMKWRYE